MNFINNITTETMMVTLIFVLVIVVIIQFLVIRKLRGLFARLSDVYSRDEKLGYLKLVERIIFSRELYTARASDEVVDLIYNYIKGLFAVNRVFVHVTNEKEIAEKIISEGFKYSENFEKTSEEVIDNIDNLKYKLLIYKNYGKFVIIICVPKNLKRKKDGAEFKLDKDLFVEYGISEYNPDNELSYRLPVRFVKGYIDTQNMLITNNKEFGKE